MNRTVPVLAAVVVLLAGCEIVIETTTPSTGEPATEPAALADLDVTAEDPEGYDRALFGDYDRDEVLAATQERWPDCDGFYSAADDQCHASEDDVQVDHIVALSEAWDSGASGWSTVQLDEFGGDLDNLWVMTTELNLAKTYGDAAEWLPPHEPAVCDYVAAYIAVKAEWGLTVDPAEHDALAAALGDCGDAAT